MALVPSTFSTALQKIFARPPRTTAATAELSAAAFMTYASSANAGAAIPDFTLLPPTFAARQKAFTLRLLAAYNDPSAGNPERFAAAWEEAVTTLWTSTLFTTVPPLDSGLAVPFPGAGAAARASIIASVSSFNTPIIAAQAIAAALDTYSRTFLVTLFPSAIVVPIT